MTEPTITCPNCQADIKLTESLAGPLVEQTRKAFAEQLSAKDQLVAKAQAEIASTKQSVEQERLDIEATLAKRMDEARKQIAMDEVERAKRVVATDIEARDRQLAELQQSLNANNAKLAEAQAAQAEIRMNTVVGRPGTKMPTMPVPRLT